MSWNCWAYCGLLMTLAALRTSAMPLDEDCSNNAANRECTPNPNPEQCLPSPELVSCCPVYWCKDGNGGTYMLHGSKTRSGFASQTYSFSSNLSPSQNNQLWQPFQGMTWTFPTFFPAFFRRFGFPMFGR